MSPGPSSRGQNLVYEFGQFQVHVGRRELLSNGVVLPLGARAFEIVEFLVQSANELVTKDDIMNGIWPGAAVGENTLQVHISAIRKALGPNRAMLKTASGRGYSLLGSWTVRQQDAARPPVGLQRMPVHTRSPVTNFPATVTRLIGRAAAVPRVRDLISAYRVVTLTGPGGIGKTSLALKVARGIVGEFADGAWLVELAPLSDPALLPSVLAGALELKLGSWQISAAALAQAIGDSNLLLLLDNCEHVIDAVAHLTETCIRLCPRVTILATSREFLRVDGECVYRVAPLEVPAADADEPDHVLSHSAVELFVTRANAFNSDFALRAENIAEVAAICRHLDGIPLAIEFAAARAATLGVQQVTTALSDRFAMLKAGRRTALPRQRTLRAALDWSYALLTEPEQRLLYCLSIFSGGFSFAGAVAVMNDCGVRTSSVAEGIANLVAKSLLVLDRQGTESRWYLLETTRAYGLGKLAESGAARQMAQSHAAYCVALFDRFIASGQLQAALDDLAAYRREMDNLRAALNWAFGPDGDAGPGSALAAASADFWLAVSLAAEACEWAAKALRSIGDAAGTRREMVLQCSLGTTLIQTRGMTEDARVALGRALSLAQKLGDLDFQQRATHHLWSFTYRAAAFHDALAMARQYDEGDGVRDPQSRAVADYLVGIPLIFLGSHTEATTRLRRTIDRYPAECRRRDAIRFGTDMPSAASGLISVGLLSQGLPEAASRQVMASIEEARTASNPLPLCGALAFASGCIFLSLDEPELVERYGEELIERAHKLGLRPLQAIGLCVRGSLAARRGDPASGIEPLRRGLAEMQELSYLLYFPYFVPELARALGATGYVDEGIFAIDAALRAAADTGHRWFAPELTRVKAELLVARGSDDPAAVTDLLYGVISETREQGALYWELLAAISLAELLGGQHREAEAHAVLAPVYNRFTEGFSVPRLRHARTLLERLR